MGDRARFGATALLLFLPKILAALRVACDRSARAYGGAAAPRRERAGEMLLSALLAPIRMLFHTQFVAMALAGRAVRWKSPPRDDAETGWRHAFARHGMHTLVGVAWAAVVWWLNPVVPVVAAAGRRRADPVDPAVGVDERHQSGAQVAATQVFPDSGGIASAAGHSRNTPLLASRAAIPPTSPPPSSIRWSMR